MRLGLFDSGSGGLSVLRTLWQNTSEISFEYFADQLNSPFGEKSKEDVYGFTRSALTYLLTRGIQAFLVACNTATSSAIAELRKEFSLPIFGMEPAIKPAHLENPGKPIAVFATPFTLGEVKFQNLMDSLPSPDMCLTIPCIGLAKAIDEQAWEEAWKIFETNWNNIKHQTNIVVLGCTHYSHLLPMISKKIPEAKVYDGNYGTAKHLIEIMRLKNGNGERNHLSVTVRGKNEENLKPFLQEITSNYELKLQP